MSSGVDLRCGLDLVLLWLWCRPAAVAPIRSLAWELPYAAGAALKRQTKTNTHTKKQKKKKRILSLESDQEINVLGLCINYIFFQVQKLSLL